jgi:hypothetical protein
MLARLMRIGSHGEKEQALAAGLANASSDRGRRSAGSGGN